MARLPRLDLAGYPQHVIQRGNNRRPIFAADEDYHYFLEKLAEGAKKWSVDIHAYVLMTNHIHLLATPQKQGGVGKLMQFIGRYYVPYFNHEYRRTGTLWEGRYKSTVVQAELYLMMCYRYIECNPVRAEGMAEHPVDYPWSSYRANALGSSDEVVTPHFIYQQLGKDDSARQAAYQRLFDFAVPERSIKQLKMATNKAWVLGDGYFKDQIAELSGRPAEARSRGGDRRSSAWRERR